MEDLPENLKSYKKTKIFDENSVPSALKKDHQTLKDVWGKIQILEGKLDYVIHSDPAEVVTLSPTKFGVVAPEMLHHVEIIGPVRFYVEFYK